MSNKEKAELYLRHKYLYYCVGKPIISDYDFDLFENELKDSGDPLLLKVIDLVDFPSLETIKSLGLNIENIAPNLKVKRDDVDYQHLSPMLSTKKVQIQIETDFSENPDYNDLILFFNKAKTDYYIAEPKYDGNGLELIYIDGKLNKILTRGDAETGKDKTKKLSILPSIPTKIDMPGTVEIRGEIIIKQKKWEDKYKSVDSNKETGSNSRNWVGGIVSKEDYYIEELLDLDFIAFSLVNINNNKVEYINNESSELKKLGFNVNVDFFTKKIKDISEFRDLYFEYKNYRENISEYQLDGIVLKYKEELRNNLSTNKKYPFWSCAIKFRAEIATAEILSIEWNNSKTGEITPVGIIYPTTMYDGRILRRVSLCNLGTIYRRKFYVGSTISLRLAGDIIGQAVDVITPSEHEREYDQQIKDFIKNQSK